MDYNLSETRIRQILSDYSKVNELPIIYDKDWDKYDIPYTYIMESSQFFIDITTREKINLSITSLGALLSLKYKVKTITVNGNYIILINDIDEVVGSRLITKNTSLGLQTTMGRVFVSKTMYTVGGEYKNEHDISWMISNKNYNKEVVEIFSGILAEKFETNDYYMIFSNLWINSDTKKQAFENYFDFNLLRSRLITSLNLKNNKISGVVREKEEFCVPTFKTNKSELS